MMLIFLLLHYFQSSYNLYFDNHNESIDYVLKDDVYSTEPTEYYYL